MNSNIKNQNKYPQCNSFDPETLEPCSILKERIQHLNREIDFSNWKPKSLLDIGTGKGFMPNFFKSLERSDAIEFLTNLKLPNHCKLHNGKFLDCIGLRVSDLVLGLRVLHYCYLETFSQNYLIKIAMLSKDRFLFESPLNFNDCEKLLGISGPLNKARKEYHVRGHDASSPFPMLHKFFKVEKQFPALCDNYVFLNCRRILPPKIVLERKYGVKREGDAWIKTGLPEVNVLQFITLSQLLGQSEIILNTVYDEKGTIHGVILKHLEDTENKEQKKRHCYELFYKLCGYLLPINYLPVDIVPNNVIGGYLIDIGCCYNVDLKISSDSWRNTLLKNDIILHHRQC